MQSIELCNQRAFRLILGESDRRFITQMTRVMRLTALIITVCCLHVSAKSWSQHITFSGEKVPLAKIFEEIRKQTNYFVAYEPAMLESALPVTVHSENLPLDEFLKVVLKDQPLTYFLKKTTIFIQEKEEMPAVKKVVSPPVTGVVKSVNGSPLGGVNVVVKGTKRGTVTKEDGSFSIEANEGEVLVVSSVGFGAREIKIAPSQSTIEISLAVSSSPLDEVQVIAYGETTKHLLTGNVASVKSDVLEKQPINNPLLGLSGRVPGLQVTQASGVPGGGVSVLIQGQNSIFNGNDPLYVIDAVPYFSQLLPNLGNILGTSRSAGLSPGENGNPLSYLNVGDIESIEILKDADVPAIVGCREATSILKKGRTLPRVAQKERQVLFTRASLILQRTPPNSKTSQTRLPTSC